MRYGKESDKREIRSAGAGIWKRLAASCNARLCAKLATLASLFLLMILISLAPALAYVQSHNLSEIRNIDTNLDMHQYSVFNATRIGIDTFSDANNLLGTSAGGLTASALYWGSNRITTENIDTDTNTQCDDQNCECIRLNTRAFDPGIENDIWVQVTTNDLYFNDEEVCTTGNNLCGDGVGISGSGNANYIPRFNTVTTLTDSVMYQSGSNIGVGTTSPAAKLHVQGGTIIGNASSSGSVVSGTGVYGTGSTYGVYGFTNNNYGYLGGSNRGVHGYGATYGVYGDSGTWGVFGNASGGTVPLVNTGVVGVSNAWGVVGSASSVGVIGNASGSGSVFSGTGVYGTGSGYGVYGHGVTGVHGQYSGGSQYGRLGMNNAAVYGRWDANTEGRIGYFDGTNYYGLHGLGSNYGVYGEYNSDTYGYLGSSSYGIYGQYNANNWGYIGSSNTGVHGEGTTYGGYFATDYVTNSTTSGIYATSTAVKSSGENRGGYFLGAYSEGTNTGAYNYGYSCTSSGCSSDTYGSYNYAYGATNNQGTVYGVRGYVNRVGTGAIYYSGYFNDVGTAGTYNGLYADVRSGGAIDIAEYIKDTLNETEAADVVVPDPDNNESVIKSFKPFDSSVVGVISTKPHMTIGLELVMNESSGKMYTDVNATKLALAGRVPVKVSDENGPIAIGDLLTTSSTPGHAMKCPIDTPEQKLKCMGAVLGKALEPLESGEGKIVALVTLQ